MCLDHISFNVATSSAIDIYHDVLPHFSPNQNAQLRPTQGFDIRLASAVPIGQSHAKALNAD